MADGLNKVMLLGNLGQDPELKMIAGGQAVLNLRLATTETYLDKNNTRQERTDWHTVTVWGKRAGSAREVPLDEGIAALRRGAHPDAQLREERREALRDRHRREQHHPDRPSRRRLARGRGRGWRRRRRRAPAVRRRRRRWRKSSPGARGPHGRSRRRRRGPGFRRVRERSRGRRRDSVLTGSPSLRPLFRQHSLAGTPGAH